MTDPIPFMTRRARLIRGETQGEFAEHMGVDQATVSRWERSRGHPTPAKLAEIHKIVIGAEPSYNPEYILASPTIKYVCKLDDFAKPLMLSQGLLEELGVTLEDVLKDPHAFWTDDDQRVNETVQSDPRWRKGEIAFIETTHKADSTRHPGRWWRTIGAPLQEGNAMLREGVLDPRPSQFLVKLTPLSTKKDAS